MDFEETLQMVEGACNQTLCGKDHNLNRDVIKTATNIYLANLPRIDLLARLKKAKERIEDLSYYTCDGMSVDQKDVLEILDELIESVKE